LALEYAAKATAIYEIQFQSYNAIEIEELSTLTFPIVLHIPVLDSRYENSVVSVVFSYTGYMYLLDKTL
jgi:hypothetical protein